MLREQDHGMIRTRDKRGTEDWLLQLNLDGDASSLQNR